MIITLDDIPTSAFNNFAETVDLSPYSKYKGETYLEDLCTEFGGKIIEAEYESDQKWEVDDETYTLFLLRFS
jgi:hypothetical protein